MYSFRNGVIWREKSGAVLAKRLELCLMSQLPVLAYRAGHMLQTDLSLRSLADIHKS